MRRAPNFSLSNSAKSLHRNQLNLCLSGTGGFLSGVEEGPLLLQFWISLQLLQKLSPGGLGFRFRVRCPSEATRGGASSVLRCSLSHEVSPEAWLLEDGDFVSLGFRHRRSVFLRTLVCVAGFSPVRVRSGDGFSPAADLSLLGFVA